MSYSERNFENYRKLVKCLEYIFNNTSMRDPIRFDIREGYILLHGVGVEGVKIYVARGETDEQLYNALVAAFNFSVALIYCRLDSNKLARFPVGKHRQDAINLIVSGYRLQCIRAGLLNTEIHAPETKRTVTRVDFDDSAGRRPSPVMREPASLTKGAAGMSADKFCYWLNGVLDAANAAEDGLTPADCALIKRNMPV